MSLFPIKPLAFLTVIALVFASVPYIAGLAIERPGEHFVGLTYNIDDACVYISWIRQVADGRLLYRNNYTNQPQRAGQFNLLFVLMGLTVRATGLSPTAVLHLFRVLLGAGLLVLAWVFAGQFIPDERKRLFFLAILAFSSGFGWALPRHGHQGPVDMWQPEAITFLSLYLNPLFLAGQILMLGAFYFLIQASSTGSLRSSALAGVLLLLLANIHTYDVLTIGAVWVSYLVVLCLMERRILWRLIALSLLAAALSLPALAYQVHLYRTEEVFRLRANTPAPSPAIWSYFLGYGAVFVAAIFGLPAALKGRKRLLIAVWAAVGFALPYLPVAQQRKLVMGLHIPLAILAAAAIWPLARRLSRRNARALGLAFICFLAIGNIRFLQNDVAGLMQNQTAPFFPPFLTDSEIRCLQWLRANTKRSDTVFASPEIALFVPALVGNNVYYGHWSETPDYKGKIADWAAFSDPTLPEPVRADILRRTGASYVIKLAAPHEPPLPFCEPVHSDGPVTIYRTVFPERQRA